jgi:hypothetical protein
MKERNRYPLSGPIYVCPGDILRVTVTEKETGKQFFFEEKIERTMMIDTVVTFDIEDGEIMLGLTDGVGAIFGKTID